MQWPGVLLVVGLAAGISVPASAQPKLKVYISADMEGVAERRARDPFPGKGHDRGDPVPRVRHELRAGAIAVA